MRYRITFENGTVVVAIANDEAGARKIATKTYAQSAKHIIQKVETLPTVRMGVGL